MNIIVSMVLIILINNCGIRPIKMGIGNTEAMNCCGQAESVDLEVLEENRDEVDGVRTEQAVSCWWGCCTGLSICSDNAHHTTRILAEDLERDKDFVKSVPVRYAERICGWVRDIAQCCVKSTEQIDEQLDIKIIGRESKVDASTQTEDLECARCVLHEKRKKLVRQ